MPTNPIPDGYHTVTPYLIVKGADGIIEFLAKGFGGEVKSRLDGPDGLVMNAELRLGSSMVMISDAREGILPQPTSLYLYVDDVDAVYAKAVAAGGISIMEPADMFYGDRHGGVMDASGNTWWIASRKENLTDEQISARMSAVLEKG